MASKGKGLREQVGGAVEAGMPLAASREVPAPVAGARPTRVNARMGMVTPPILSCVQDLSTLDVTKLTPLSPEVISRQATINIGGWCGGEGRRHWAHPGFAWWQWGWTLSGNGGSICMQGACPVPGWGGVGCSSREGGGAANSMCLQFTPPLHHPRALAGTIGHVAHGKSTVVKAISGVQTVRFKNELERNITIKLGYANAKIYACSDPKCPRPAAYRAYSSSKEDAPPCDVPGFEGVPMTLLRHVSFVDCPGHDILMATMLNGAAVMDGALLLIAANEPCPQPQTSEHLAAVEIMQLRHIIILQNKVDLVTESAALNQAEAIARFVQGTIAEPAPVVPVSAQLKYNIDAVCEYLVKKIPIPVRDFVSPPQARVLEVWEGTKGGGSHALGACSCRARGDAEPPGRLNVGEANPAIPMRRPSSR